MSVKSEVAETMKHLLFIAVSLLPAGCSSPVEKDDPASRAAFQIPGVLTENSPHGNVEIITITIDSGIDPATISDPLLSHVKGLPELRVLQINNIYGQEYPITDQGIKKLIQATTLEQVRLQFALITDQGIQTLLNLPNLKTLDLTGTEITDHGVSLIAQKQPQLRQLSLNDTEITGECAGALISLQNLETLDLMQTRLTNEQARTIKENMPTCSILHSSRSPARPPSD